MSYDSNNQQAWWDSMSPEQREAYEDAQARRKAEREVAAEREHQDWLRRRALARTLPSAPR